MIARLVIISTGHATGFNYVIDVQGQTVRLTIKGTPKEGYHTYPLTRRTPTQDEAGLSQITFGPSPQLRPLWPVAESEP